MAISPKDLEDYNTDVEKTMIEKYEIEIDEMLRSGDRKFPSDEIDNSAKMKLIEKYEKVGWTVSEHRYNDAGCKQGYYLKFEKVW